MLDSRLKKSYILEEQEKYVKFDREGRTSVSPRLQDEGRYSYRKIHLNYDDSWLTNINADEYFIDPDFQIRESDLQKLHSLNGKIILKRLYDLYRLYPEGQRPKFFPNSFTSLTKVKSPQLLPSFINQLGILPNNHYKSLFLTQQFVEHGFYEIIVNKNGRFEANVVDDQIPVYEKTLEPIWGMSIEEGWKIMLLKMYAKISGGYKSVEEASGFDFIQCFTNSNWKYYNLKYDGHNFLQYHSKKIGVGKLVAKTKNDESVRKAGLIANYASYEIINIRKQRKSDKWILLIRSIFKNKWAGNFSVVDEEVNSMYDPSYYKMMLQHDFLMNSDDFFNLFAAVYVCSKREEYDCISEYHILRISNQSKNATYLQLNFKRHGFFDYCIKQFSNNAITAETEKSRMRAQNQNMLKASSMKKKPYDRYLKCKYALIKINNVNELSYQQKQSEFLPLQCQTYDMNYSHGYNRGDASFLEVTPGKYLLRIKLEKSSEDTDVVINYSCQQKIQMRQIQLEKDKKSVLMRQAMVSNIGEMSRYMIQSSRISKKKQVFEEEICYGEKFEELGYGFVGVRSRKMCPYNILIEVNPKLLKQQGFGLKYPFKNISQIFAIKVKPGEMTSIVLKKKKQGYVWPPKGIQFFRKKTKI